MTEKQREVIKKGPLKSVIIDFNSQVYLVNGQEFGEATGLNISFDGMDWTAAFEFDKEQHLYEDREPHYPKPKSRPHKQTADELTSD